MPCQQADLGLEPGRHHRLADHALRQGFRVADQRRNAECGGSEASQGYYNDSSQAAWMAGDKLAGAGQCLCCGSIDRFQ